MSSKKEARVKATMELPKAISYLNDVVASLKAGRVTVANGDTGLSVTPEEAVKVEVKATQKADKESISIELSWRKPEEVHAQVNLRISSEEPSHERKTAEPVKTS